MKKYELTNEIGFIRGKKVYRIKALKNFADVKIGDLGGYVESERNLSHEGDCWLYHGAVCYENAIVRENAKATGTRNLPKDCDETGYLDGTVVIGGNAKVSGKALLRGGAHIEDMASVRDNAIISGGARIHGNAVVCDDAKVYGYAGVGGYARVGHMAIVEEFARVYGMARVLGESYIAGFCKVFGDVNVIRNSKMSQRQIVSFGIVSSDIDFNKEESIRCQTGLGVFNNKVIAYKEVNNDLTSIGDNSFQYVIGEYAEVKYPEISNNSCAPGLHFSNMNYWNKETDLNSVFLMAEIDIEDVITVQEGKIRCKRAKILGKYKTTDDFYD